MSPTSRRELEERARIAIELADVGIKIMRQNLRRRFPDEPEDEIDRRLAEWLQTRPGAEQGDAWGSPIPPDPERFLRVTRNQG